MLTFLRQAVIRDAKEPLDRNFDTHFFPSFADRTASQCLQKIDFAANNAPAASLGRMPAKSKQDAAGVVENQDANADARLCVLLIQVWRYGAHAVSLVAVSCSEA
jgi:hypothetical protein